ncbi:MAG: putative baseplate assembly protein, partial [Thermoproteota archaeon]|nr:putative baseplate assembly protein [Thermoproteota archaeon]
MSTFIDKPGTGTPRLDACGCCDVALPRPELYNRPGLPALAYRIDIHPTALRRMLKALPTQPVPPDDPDNPRPLKTLSTRAGDDPAIALLDAWATVTDVLTFYQERIANEGFLRTATERGSVLELARAIGYELNPGVAASTFLAFTVEDAPGLPGVASVPEGTKIQSIPGQDQLPQTFETVEAIEARAGWNTLRPRLTIEQEIDATETELYLKGVNTQLQPGDTILLVGDEREGDPYSERWDVRTLQTVTPFPPETEAEEGYTLVTWELGLGHENPTVSPADNPRAFAFRQRAALFGHNAPDWRAMPDSVKQAYDASYDPDNPDRRRTQWPDFEIQTIEERLIDLDAVYPKILADSWIVLARPGYTELYRAEEVTTSSRTDFTLTAKTTRIKLDTNRHLSWFGVGDTMRDTAVFAQSEQLE